MIRVPKFGITPPPVRLTLSAWQAILLHRLLEEILATSQFETSGSVTPEEIRSNLEAILTQMKEKMP